jgi:hypothetical protein
MAISQGVGPHFAWLNVSGATLPIEQGSVNQSAQRKTAGFHVTIPMNFPGAEAALAGISDRSATIVCETRGVTGTLFTGEVSRFDFDNIGRKITVTGHDPSMKLHDNKTSEKWQNKLPSDIVSDLIGRVGLSGNITSSALMAGKKLQQDFVKLSDNVSFGYVIHKMAELDGARWFVDPNGTFHYIPFGTNLGTYSITIDQSKMPISADCLSLKITRNLHAAKSLSATVRAWHPRKKQVFQYQSTIPGSGGTINYNYHIPTLDQEHVKKYAQSLLNERARHELTVSATVVGDPTVYAGMGLTLTGTGYFDQTYDIDTVHHKIGMSGHTTSLTARSAKAGRQAS